MVQPERRWAALMRAILHVGFPKTGTTSIQAYCSRNTTALREHGILYPETGRKLWFKDRKRHIGFAMACEVPDQPPSAAMKSYGLTTARARQRFTRTFLRRLDREIARNRDAAVAVFSDEGLSSFRDPRMLQFIHDQMTARFDSVTIVCMLREPAGYLASAYSQYIKMGGVETWQMFKEKRLSTTLFLDRIATWQDIFGRDQVLTRVLQRDAVAQFQELLGLPPATDSAERENPSLSRFGLDLLRAVNAEYKRLGKTRPASVRQAFAAHLTGPGLKASVAESGQIYHACADEIAGLVARCDLPEADLVYISEYWQPRSRTTDAAPGAALAEEQLAAMLAKLFSR